MAASDRTEHADPIAAVGAAAPNAAGVRPGRRRAPHRVVGVGVGDHVVEPAGDPEFGGVFECEHRRGVAARMMLRGNAFRGGGGAGGQPWGDDARRPAGTAPEHGGGGG